VPPALTSKTPPNFKNSIFLARASLKHYWAQNKNNIFESYLCADLYLQYRLSIIPIYIQNRCDKTWKNN